HVEVVGEVGRERQPGESGNYVRRRVIVEGGVPVVDHEPAARADEALHVRPVRHQRGTATRDVDYETTQGRQVSGGDVGRGERSRREAGLADVRERPVQAGRDGKLNARDVTDLGRNRPVFELLDPQPGRARAPPALVSVGSVAAAGKSLPKGKPR